MRYLSQGPMTTAVQGLRRSPAVAMLSQTLGTLVNKLTKKSNPQPVGTAKPLHIAHAGAEAGSTGQTSQFADASLLRLNIGQQHSAIPASQDFWHASDGIHAHACVIIRDGKAVNVPVLGIELSASWLRHNCPGQRQEGSGQRISSILSYSSPKIRAFELDGMSPYRWKVEFEDGYASVWQEQDVYAVLPFLLKSAESLQVPDIRHIEDSSQLCAVDLPDILQNEATLLDFLQNLHRDGAVIVKDCGTSDNQVVKLCERAAQVPLHTMYGTTFEVKTTSVPINIAYSNAELPLHQDLVYYESSPGVQLLHCRRFDSTVAGGLSTLADGIQAAEKMQASYPEEFELLCKVPATFQKIHYAREWPVQMVYRRPHIETDDQGIVNKFVWAPAFEGPLACSSSDPELTEQYFEAYRKLANIVENEIPTVSFRLREGEMFVFNNSRMLHGRTAFHGDGIRHFQGAYMNIDEVSSKMAVLQQTLLGAAKPARWCNGSAV